MNKSFDGGQSNHYLPPISRNDSTNIQKARKFTLIQIDPNLIMKSIQLEIFIQLPSLESFYKLNLLRIFKNMIA